MKWSEPSDPDWKPGSTGERGHRIRSFCCAALLLALSVDTEGYLDGDNQILAQLIDSANESVHDLGHLLAEFIVWRYDDLLTYDEPDFYAFAISVIALIDKNAQNEEHFDELANWMLRLEKLVRIEDYPNNASWLLGTTHMDLCHNKWKEIAKNSLNVIDKQTGPNAVKLRILLQCVSISASIPASIQPHV